MRLGFYAYDVGPAHMLATIAVVAKSRGHDVIIAPQQKDDGWMAHKHELQGCDLVCGSFSAFKMRGGGERVPVLEEIHMVNALRFDEKAERVPFVLIEDVPGTSLRPAAVQGLRKRPLAAAVVSTHHQIETTQKNAKIRYQDVVYVGPPAHWRTSYNDMIFNSPVVSFTKTKGEQWGFTDARDVTVFCVGGKDPYRDLELVELVVKIGKEKFGERFVFVFKTHPGEAPIRNKSPDGFDRRDEFLRTCDTWRAVINPHWTVARIIRSVSMTIFVGTHTDSIIAAYARIPGIVYSDERTPLDLRLHGIEGRWFVSELGGMLEANGEEELKTCMELLATPLGIEYLKMNQKRHFIPPEDWNTAPKIVEYLESLVR